MEHNFVTPLDGRSRKMWRFSFWIGCCPRKKTPDGWKLIAFASRFLIPTEERYSVNELELLGVFWSTDQSNLKEHKSNQSYDSRLSRWIDRLLPYNFTIESMPGAKKGRVHYITRNTFAKAKKKFHMTNILQ